MRRFIPFLLLVLLAGCGAETVGVAATTAKLQAGGWTFLENLPAKAEQRCRSPAGGSLCRSRRFDEFCTFNEPTKILLVQMTPRNRLDAGAVGAPRALADERRGAPCF